MTPARGKVLVKRVTTEEKAAGSVIIIPDSARESMSAYQMLVVSVGAPEFCNEPEECQREHIKAPKDELALFFGQRPILDRVIAMSESVHPTDKRLVPDAWVVVAPRSLTEGYDEGTYLVNQSDIQGVFVERV